MENRKYERIYSIIVAAGKGRRVGGDIPKQLLPYGNGTVLEIAVRKFAGSEYVSG